MRRIYQNAHNVIIWLGPSTRRIDYLFSWMLRLENMVFCSKEERFIKEFIKVDPADSIVMWKYFWDLICQPWKTKTASNIVREGFQILLGREWFHRIWVIQEAALAQSATISSGRNTISSQTFVMMPELLRISCNENVQARLEVMPGLLRKTSWWSGPECQNLSMLLRKFGKSKAKDPRDIIYALLGLSKDASESDVLHPNYEISLQEVIQRTVFYLLTRSGHAELLDHDDLPTWDMGQFLSALDHLPSHFRKWASRHEEELPQPYIPWHVGYEYRPALASWRTVDDTPWTGIDDTPYMGIDGESWSAEARLQLRAVAIAKMEHHKHLIRATARG